MAETLAKSWYKHGTNVIELTANTDGIIYDVYPSKWKLIKKSFGILWYIMSKKLLPVASKQEFVIAAGYFIDKYYEDEIIKSVLKEELKNELIPELGVGNKAKDETPTYIG